MTLWPPVYGACLHAGTFPPANGILSRRWTVESATAPGTNYTGEQATRWDRGPEWAGACPGDRRQAAPFGPTRIPPGKRVLLAWYTSLLDQAQRVYWRPLPGWRGL